MVSPSILMRGSCNIRLLISFLKSHVCSIMSAPWTVTPKTSGIPGGMDPS